MFAEKPRTLRIDGRKVPINPDFRIMCEYPAAVRKKDKKKLAELAGRFYFAGLTDGISAKAAVNAMSDFYINGLAPGEKDKKGSAFSKSRSPCFDFEEDEAYFYAAFLSEYGIDLDTAGLHWLTFCALFRGLPDECRLKRIISVRSANLLDIKNPAEKSRIRKLKAVFKLSAAESTRYGSIKERDKAAKEEIKARFEEIERLREKEGGRL